MNTEKERVNWRGVDMWKLGNGIFKCDGYVGRFCFG